MQHFDLVEGQSQTLCVATAGLQLLPQHRLHVADILFQLRVVCGIGLCCIQERPPKEILYILTLDFGRRRISEPFPQIPLRVWDVLMAAPKQNPAIVAGESRGMSRSSLQVEIERDVDDEEERRFKSEPYL
jgi:hypothetical protein